MTASLLWHEMERFCFYDQAHRVPISSGSQKKMVRGSNFTHHSLYEKWSISTHYLHNIYGSTDTGSHKERVTSVQGCDSIPLHRLVDASGRPLESDSCAVGLKDTVHT